MMTIWPQSRFARVRCCLWMFLGGCALLWGCGYSVAAKVRYQPQVGDLLFQSLPSPPGLDLVDAIEGATESPYSHCGVVVKKGGDWFVLEGMVPQVQETALDKWLARGRGQFAAYRLREELRGEIPDWITEMRTKLGLPYDFRYRMSEEAIYCSELPYDAWLAVTGESMGELVTLGELKWQKYRSVIERIEGTTEMPLDRVMITPRDLAKAPQLEPVLKNGLP